MAGFKENKYKHRSELVNLVDALTPVVYVRSQDTAYFPVFISPVAAGHVGVSISAEMRSPNKKKSKPSSNVCLLLRLMDVLGERKGCIAAPLSGCSRKVHRPR